MKFSILIANYNNGRFFQDCWNSLLAQTCQNWEAVIVDDKSTDNSLELINAILKGDRRAKVFVNNENLGCGYTKKRCAELATGDVYGFVDPDDALAPNALEIMQDTFETHTGIVLAYSKLIRCNEHLVSLNKNYEFAAIDSGDVNFFNLTGTINHFVVFKASAYKLTAGIDPYMLRAVDQDLYLKLCEQGPTRAVNEYLYKYRIHDHGISTGNGGVNAVKAEYWHWYAINTAAKRRGVYVEDLFTKVFTKKNAYDHLNKEYELLKNSRTYKLGQKIAGIAKLFGKK